MSKRFRNAVFAFGLSLTMWGGIIYGSLGAYAALKNAPVSSFSIASAE